MIWKGTCYPVVTAGESSDIIGSGQEEFQFINI